MLVQNKKGSNKEYKYVLVIAGCQTKYDQYFTSFSYNVTY